MSGLNFQDFNVDLVGSSNSPFTSSSSGDNNKKSTSQLIGQVGDSSSNSGTPSAETKPHFLSFGFYQRYFDVDTTQVQSRILHSFLPSRSVNFITDHIQPLPDLYGPFWICVTLVFSIAIFGNFAHYIQYASAPAGNSYENDFGLVTSATTLIFFYVIFVPFAIYSFMWHRKTMVQYSYMEMVCAYGYSLAIFVPVSVLWVVELQWFRWLLIVVSVAASGLVLFGTFWPVVSSDPNRLAAFGFIAGVVALHALLAVGFKEFYFDASMPAHPRLPIPSAEKLNVISTILPPTTLAVGLSNNKSRRAVIVHASSPIVLTSSAPPNVTTTNVNDTTPLIVNQSIANNISHIAAVSSFSLTNDTTIAISGDHPESANHPHNNKTDDQKNSVFPNAQSEDNHNQTIPANNSTLSAVGNLPATNSTVAVVGVPSSIPDAPKKNSSLPVNV